ncbi:hypothetical protein COV82_02080 [Candidatus Peregrinibacteria bacterium CG11_big_fil_rev_8_21_14_0_20_46_8]|nr:MAG: hypothetical protein COV82_02080 [Candidatus Peregrinibacteria bacterium CG11_big_fil_rev_8_21_14_0_20_46_8]
MLSSLQQYRRLLRIEQWYKNLVIFLPLLFADSLLLQPPLKIFWGFLGFCCISSASYILNDWRDRKEDALHPTKKTRPLASGKISGTAACTVVLLLSTIVLAVALQLGIFYSSVLAIYAVFTTLYSFGLKHIPILDIAMIAFNFVLRMSAGFLEFPPYETIFYFLALFALIVVFGTYKRRSDIKLVGEKAAQHKPVLRFYTKCNAYTLRIISILGLGWSLVMLVQLHALGITTALVFSIFLGFSLYLFSQKPHLVIKPHYLLRIWYWDLLVLLCIGIVFMTS